MEYLLNIVRKHLGNRGLHLNEYGASRLAMNYITARRKLCQVDVKLTESLKKDVSKIFETTEGNCEDNPFKKISSK